MHDNSGRRGRVFESRRFDSLAGAPGSLLYKGSVFLFFTNQAPLWCLMLIQSFILNIPSVLK